MNSIPAHIAELLNLKFIQYHTTHFISEDPICIPHLFSKKQDIEIAAFLTAIISWGNRKSIIAAAKHLMTILQFQPHSFVMNYSKSDDKYLKKFYYRTFQPTDTIYFIRMLSHYYVHHQSLEEIFL